MQQPADNNSNLLPGTVTGTGAGLTPEEGEGGGGDTSGVVVPCTPARLEEIKSILLTIYLEYR